MKNLYLPWITDVTCRRRMPVGGSTVAVCPIGLPRRLNEQNSNDSKIISAKAIWKRAAPFEGCESDIDRLKAKLDGLYSRARANASQDNKPGQMLDAA